MTIKTAIIGATTAIAIAAASVAVPHAASAAPFAAVTGAPVETQAAGIERVKQRKGHGGHHRHHRGRGVNPGTAAAIGVGALILGAAIAGSSAYAAPRCRVVRVERWSPRYQAYVIRNEEICD